MLDLFVSTLFFALAHHNANAGPSQYAHGQLPPQSNQYVCRDKHYGNGVGINHDLCDRQGGYTGR